MSKALITTTAKEEIKKKQLRLSIMRKRAVLQKWTEKVEELSMDLEMIQHEYNVRIGYLLLKDNQLDLEIIQLRNVQHLMEQGLTYQEALRKQEDTFYNEILEKQKIQEEEIQEEKEILEKREQLSDTTKEELKVIWKRLIRKFHPDLAMDEKEKERREGIMKKINNAYTEGDIDVLLALEENEAIDDIASASITSLEENLVKIENMILFWRESFVSLRQSEWYAWKKKIDKAKKDKTDVFADLERRLLDDIVRKIEIAQRLRNSVGAKEM